MTWPEHGPSSLNWVHQEWKANSWPTGQCQISIKNIFFIKYIFSNGNDNEMAMKIEIEGLKFFRFF